MRQLPDGKWVHVTTNPTLDSEKLLVQSIADAERRAARIPTLEAGIPPEACEYKLGSKSALDWVIDQYQVKGESDPNREDDPGYIVRLVGQVVRLSVETVRLVNALPPFLSQTDV